MSIIILIIIILIGLFGVADVDEPDCAAGEDGCIPPPVEVAAWEAIEVDGVKGVIVAETDGPLFLQAEAYWTPTTADIATAEAAIAAEQGDLDHLRQYVGFVEDGERKVYINGFCDAFGYNWQSEPVLVEDGGECYFEATYNVESSELEGFMFNGEA